MIEFELRYHSAGIFVKHGKLSDCLSLDPVSLVHFYRLYRHSLKLL